MILSDFYSILRGNNYCVISTPDDGPMIIWKQNNQLAYLVPLFSTGYIKPSIATDFNNYIVCNDLKQALQFLVGTLLNDDADWEISEVTPSNIFDLYDDDQQYVMGNYFYCNDNCFKLYLNCNNCASIVTVNKSGTISIEECSVNFISFMTQLSRGMSVKRCCNSFLVYNKLLEFLS